MRKLTRKNLDELAKGMPVISELGQRRFVGGGYSTGITGADTMFIIVDADDVGKFKEMLKNR